MSFMDGLGSLIPTHNAWKSLPPKIKTSITPSSSPQKDESATSEVSLPPSSPPLSCPLVQLLPNWTNSSWALRQPPSTVFTAGTGAAYLSLPPWGGTQWEHTRCSHTHNTEKQECQCPVEQTLNQRRNIVGNSLPFRPTNVLF